ncbi:MAG: nicotinamide-nucleotide adenylyltransferase, partial [Thermoplasmata archaeon]
IVAIEDLHNDKLWVDRVADLVPDLQVVYSNDPLTIRLLQERGFDARVMPLVERDALSGTEVRRRMLEDRDWEALVPPAVRDVLIEMGGLERIRRTAGKTSDTDED